ncbi:DUF2117 domain-containing protein [Methanohalophilus sp.]|uniref:DUF2117 domain-containing protein n=1 Tax=Methanohalophilus sp. TaxID=1966352 RepID=UPI0026194167|nr:DUF2117 domain-containing protein [Methanohalophilus sp.]MDK2892278.1 hypothetical protein [Methanohalophilus sp.]
MKVGVIIHGPEVVDSGKAGSILSLLRSKHEVSAIAVGTMGRVAVREASLKDVDISQRLKPSKAIEKLALTCQYVLLLNTGKSLESGLSFGRIVSSKISLPFIQIERPGLDDGKIISWGIVGKSFLKQISVLLQLPVEENSLGKYSNIFQDRGRICRKVESVVTGELIMVNGIVVGKAFSDEVTIIFEKGFIVDIIGAKVRKHGIEKLHSYDLLLPLDIQNVWVKSGPLRCSTSGMLCRCGDFLNKKDKGEYSVLIIDHDSESIFDRVFEGYDAVITVGDDTTFVASEILSGFGIPVIGITDGDRDDVMAFCRIPCRSTIFRLKSGNDDRFGKLIFTNIFGKKEIGNFPSLTFLERQILDMAGNLMEYTIYF